VEQLNIVGRRSGEGFVAHKAVLVNALSRALANAVVLMGLTIERKGLLGYLKALGGSNVIKVTPCAGSASGSQATSRRLKVICGANTAYLQDMAWVGEKVPLTLCEVRVSPNNSVKPNIGSLELAEALNRVLPFTAKDDTRPVLSCVNFEAKDGKLTLVSADGFRLAVVSLDYEDGEGQALISRSELRGIPQALKRAKRARISFEPSGTSLDGINLILDTELIRYKWTGYSGSYPEWQKLIPIEFKTFAHFDAIEAIKVTSSLKVLADSKSYPIDLTIGDGKIVMANPDDKGQAEVSCDTDGEIVRVRIDGSYLNQALRACGGMVDFKLTNAYSPMLFTEDGYQLVVMPMMTTEATEQAKRDREAKPEEAKAEDTATEQAEVVAENKPKRSRKREAVAVA
jgi:hypothetical protein